MADLAGIIKRLEKATGPDRELDADIFCVAHPELMKLLPHWTEEQRDNIIPRYTPSLDAAIDLVERVLPECAWSVQRDYGDYCGAHLNVFPHQYGGPVNYNEQADTVPLALLVAILRALEAQGQKK